MVLPSRRGKPLEQVRPIWFFFAITITLFLALFCIIYFDCGSLLRWDGKTREIRRGAELHKAFANGNTSSECDWFDGEWIWDEKYPLYDSKNCPFLDLGFRCSENGRSDSLYSHWRWQPKRCDLPRSVYFLLYLFSTLWFHMSSVKLAFVYVISFCVSFSWSGCWFKNVQ
jgi:PMR5 N terminal Domain